MRMRIVGLSEKYVFIQIQESALSNWKQVRMSNSEFATMMWDSFPKYFKQYLSKATPAQSAAEFFYNYGETEAMRRRGDAYIYEN